MKNCIKLNWPSLQEDEHLKIISCFNERIHQVKQVTKISENLDHSAIDVKNQSAGFYHLFYWENYEDFFADLFKNYKVSQQAMKLFSIQRSLEEVVPHSDIGRKFIIYYLVEGTGDTSFYHSNNYLAGKSYEEKNLTITETIQLEQGHWYLFNNQAIHGVKNISKPRYSLAFDISKIYNSYEQAYTDVEDSKILFL